jgi:hypothetical protein
VGAQQKHVQQAGEGSTVAAGGYVAVSDITDDSGTGELGDPGGLSQLQSPFGNVAIDPVVDGLAVRAHDVDRAVTVNEALRHSGEELAYFHV